MRSAKGFTFIEVAIWILIIGVVFAMTFQIAFKKKPTDSFPYILTELNSLAALANSTATSQSVPCKLVIEQLSSGGFKSKVMQRVKDGDGFKFKQIDTGLVSTDFTANEKVKLENAYSGEKGVGFEKNKTFVMFSPEGSCQSMILHASRVDSDMTVEVSFELNPFLCQFESSLGFKAFSESKN